MNQFAASPTIGFNTNPTAPNVTNGFAPAFFWDDGFPAANLVLPPRIDPSVANGTSPSALPSNSFDLPRYQNWSVTAERQIGQNILLDVSYIGNRGSRLTNSAASLGVRDNMNNPSVLSLGAALLNSDINSPAAQAAGIQSPYPGFVGNVAQALRPFPQYQNIGYWAVPTGSSAYNALEVGLRKRFSGGLQAQFSYTWSKFMTDTAEYGMAGLDPGPQNPLDPHKGEWARSQDNVPQTFILSYTYELPFGKGKPLLNMGGPLNKVVGGWKVSGVQRYEAGRPLALFMNNDLGGFLFSSTNRPNKVGSGLGNTSRGMNPATDRYLNASGFADPGPLQFGAETRTDATINTFPYYTEDLNFIKDTKLYQESVNLRFEGQMTNILNRHTWCDPNTNWSSPSFGVVSGQCDQPRRIQFGLKLEF